MNYITAVWVKARKLSVLEQKSLPYAVRAETVFKAVYRVIKAVQFLGKLVVLKHIKLKGDAFIA